MRQAEGALPLLRRETAVARREGEAVGVAHRRDDADLHGDVQVADEPPDHGDLLRILLAEVRALRVNEVEQLQADRGDTAEVAGTGCAFGSHLAGIDPGGEARRIELVGGRREHDVDSFGLSDLDVARLVARIRVEVRLLVELRRIDEERHHDRAVLLPGCSEERDVAVVEGSHRRHEARSGHHLELGDRADDLHASCTVASASVS